YIYVSKPGGGYLGVNLYATDYACNTQHYKYKYYYLPSCGGGSPWYINNPGHITVKLPDDPVDPVGKTQVTDGAKSISIIGLDGRIYHQQTAYGEQAELVLDRPLTTGVYVLRISTELGEYSEKILIP
ncbi:MAG: T9SS type A sorting domain-containing protein, partial [Bacteroidota bacterium]